ncbi:hypothetical protein GCM10009623_08210 [Nocardioides aestuarii]|uniref:T7SS-secreted protein n=1 Tax=Nocardioides aestuarii TaxID=252231 RepID=A0ABW4TF21_9ACTN
MSATSAADYPTLGFDPTPGDHAQVTSLGSTLGTVSRAMNEICNVLQGADDGEWRGDAARGFRNLLDDDVRPKVSQAADAFEIAHRAVSDWAVALGGFQSRARGLELQAAAAARDAAAARTALDGLPGPDSPPPAADDTAAQAQARQDAADRARHQGELSAASGLLADLRAAADRLHGEYDERGGDAASSLRDAISIAPEEPGWFESAIDAVAHLFHELGELLADVGDWLMSRLEELAPYLEILGDICGIVATVLGFLAMIPGLQFLAPFALGFAIAALALGYLAGVGESGSLLEPLTTKDFWMDAVGVATAGFGAFAARGLTTAASAAGNTRLVPQLIGRPIEVPYSMFHMAGRGMGMSNTEGLWRLANLRGVYAGLGATGAGVNDSLADVRDIFTLNYDFGARPRVTPGDLAWT